MRAHFELSDGGMAAVESLRALSRSKALNHKGGADGLWRNFCTQICFYSSWLAGANICLFTLVWLHTRSGRREEQIKLLRQCSATSCLHNNGTIQEALSALLLATATNASCLSCLLSHIKRTVAYDLSD